MYFFFLCVAELACTCMLTHAWFSVRCWRPWLEPGRRTWRRWHPPYLRTPTNSSSLMICDCLSTAIKSLFILCVCLLLVMLVLSVKVFIPQLMINSIIWRIGRDTGCPFAIGNLSLKFSLPNIFTGYWFDMEIYMYVFWWEVILCAVRSFSTKTSCT